MGSGGSVSISKALEGASSNDIEIALSCLSLAEKDKIKGALAHIADMQSVTEGTTTADRALEVFQHWNLDQSGKISGEELGKALAETGETPQEAVSALLSHIDADGDGYIQYAEFANWLFSSSIPTDGKFLEEHRCPDEHTLSVFTPEVDGWCCEECGEDLEEGHEVLRCAECDGLCWCIPCSVQLSTLEAAQGLAISLARATLDRHIRDALEQEEAEKAAKETAAVAATEAAAAKDELVEEEALPSATGEPAEGPVTLIVSSLAGELCTMEANRAWKGSDVKAAIETEIGVAQIGQTLVCEFVALQDDATIGSLTCSDPVNVILLRRSEQHVELLKKIRDKSVKRIESLLCDAPPEICGDRVIVLEAVSRLGVDLQYATEDLRADHDVVLAACFTSGPEYVLQYAPPSLLADRDFALKLVTHYGMFIQFLSAELRSDREVVLRAVSQTGYALAFVGEELLFDSEIYLTALDAPHGLKFQQARRWTLRFRGARDLSDYHGIAVAVVRADSSQLSYVSRRLLQDRFFALDVLTDAGWHLSHLSREVWRDDEVVIHALENGFTLRGAPGKIKCHRNVAYHTVSRRGRELEYAAEFAADRKIVTAAVKQDGTALQFAAFQLRNERRIVEAALKNNRGAIKFAGAHLRKELAA